MIQSRTNGNVTIIDIGGPLHILNAEEFRTAFHQAIADFALIALNMTAVNHVDSSGIGALIQAKTKVRDANGNMVMFGVVPEVLSVLTMAGLKVYFNLQDSEGEAIDYLKKHAGEG